MAQMPRGEPRSVPDPDGELYDEMIRREKLKRALAEAGAVPRRSAESNYGLSFSRPDFSQSKRNPIVMVDGRQIDTRCVVGGQAPASQAELADRRRAMDRASYMAANPLAAAGYGIAALLGGSERQREAAMLVGGGADAAMLGAAPRGAPIGSRPAPPRVQPPPTEVNAGAVRMREVNGLDQARGVNRTVAAPLRATGKRPDRRLRPPGWQGNGTEFNEARAHLDPDRFGGSHDDRRNFVTFTQTRANNPHMSTFEADVARRVNSGEIIEYSATPIYSEGVLPPWAVLQTARGDRGTHMARLVGNPAGRRR